MQQLLQQATATRLFYRSKDVCILNNSVQPCLPTGARGKTRPWGRTVLLARYECCSSPSIVCRHRLNAPPRGCYKRQGTNQMVSPCSIPQQGRYTLKAQGETEAVP